MSPALPIAQRWAFGVSYFGNRFQGWQIQRSGLATVQGTLEHALSTFLDAPHSVVCAGRTDTGVHALGQVVHFDTQVIRPQQSWLRGLNALLPNDVSVSWASPVAANFDARFSAVQRTYHYVLYCAPVRSAIWNLHTGWVFRPIDIEAMRLGLASIVGTHDFSAFRASQCQANSPIRTVQKASIQQRGAFVVISITANAFLHHMIRNIVGTLVEIGVGRQRHAWMAELLGQKNRRLAAPTFAAAGLYLAQVDYPPEFGLSELGATELSRFPFLSFSAS